MVFKDSKKSLRKNPKLKRRNNKGNFNLKKSHGIYIYRLSLCVSKESVRVLFPRFSVKKEVFFPEKKKKELAVFFRPK